MIVSLYDGRYEIECGRAAFDVPFQSIEKCVRMKTAVSAHFHLFSCRYTQYQTFP